MDVLRSSRAEYQKRAVEIVPGNRRRHGRATGTRWTKPTFAVGFEWRHIFTVKHRIGNRGHFFFSFRAQFITRLTPSLWPGKEGNFFEFFVDWWDVHEAGDSSPHCLHRGTGQNSGPATVRTEWRSAETSHYASQLFRWPSRDRWSNYVPFFESMEVVPREPITYASRFEINIQFYGIKF